MKLWLTLSRLQGWRWLRACSCSLFRPILGAACRFLTGLVNRDQESLGPRPCSHSLALSERPDHCSVVCRRPEVLGLRGDPSTCRMAPRICRSRFSLIGRLVRLGSHANREFLSTQSSLL